MKVIIIASGGLDSTCLITKSLNDVNITDIALLHFDYGSKHAGQENAALRRVAKQLEGRRVRNLPIYVMDIDLSYTNSALINPNVEIPKGHYQSPEMQATVVSFRNGIFLAYAASLAESLGFDSVMYGGHAGDHAIYPDCRPGFASSMGEAILEGTDDKVTLYSPFINMSKSQIIQVSEAEPGLLAMTYSCYEGGEDHCGTCGTCIERQEAFALAGVEDLTLYETPVKP